MSSIRIWSRHCLCGTLGVVMCGECVAEALTKHVERKWHGTQDRFAAQEPLDHAPERPTPIRPHQVQTAVPQVSFFLGHS